MNFEEKSELASALNELSKQLKYQRRRRWWFYGFILIILFLPSLLKNFKEQNTTQHVAMIDIKGVIADGNEANAQDIINSLNDAAKNDTTVAIFLNINSGGGSPVQSAQIYRAIQKTRATYNKPIYAFIADAGASGAYYIAAAADKIFADSASIVGSIGVISQQFAYKDLAHKIGLEPRIFTAGEHKDFLSGNKELNPKEVNHMNQLLTNIHQQFIRAVKEGRGNKLADDPDLFSGLFWTGEQAKNLGLIDEIASIPEILAREFPEISIVNYTYQLDVLTKLEKSLSATAIGEALFQGFNQLIVR